MKMDLDERIYCLINLSDSYKVEAVGVRLENREDCLVGVYMFWDKYENPREFLEEVVREFGEARLYAQNKDCNPGLVCKMTFDAPNLSLLSESARGYRELKLDLLEMRASDPTPFLALKYDSQRRLWIPKPAVPVFIQDSSEGYTL